MRNARLTKSPNKKVNFLVDQMGRIKVLVDTGLGPVLDGREVEEFLEDKYHESDFIDYFFDC